ncbi:MAG TPA: DNA-processing protein DprA [Methylocella sp.]|jgi:DNA processing protein|nr:DNA-processing protein DprA [Methylocella sp.]
MMELDLGSPANGSLGISPQREMGAYEALWDEDGATFKTISEKLSKRPDTVPSDLVEPKRVEKYREAVRDVMAKANVERFGVRVLGAGEYPDKLRDADYPIAVFYYRGWWDLINSSSVAVVGTRTPSEDGIKRTRTLVKELVKDDFTIVSGLAKGIDRVAHETAIEGGGRTIAVLGTPISHAYPVENRELQERIAREFLLISQVPIKRWQSQGPKQNRIFFPERNITMSALTEATIIVEAGETSGTLVQARHALKQGRKLFILDSCFNNTDITWPHRFAEQGAIRVRNYADVSRHLSAPSH